ncbi:MAG: hypothetical protein IID13_05270 [Candidatus Marinimicrobia bacterium]|nr:hypothetical protein [Candidatus Neomarinimicrobiota bacterium]
MKRLVIIISFSFFSMLGIFMLSAGTYLVTLVGPVHPLLGWLAGLFLAMLFLAAVVYPLASLVAALFRTRRSWVAGSWAHNRYLARLARQHRRYPVIDLALVATTESPQFLNEVYIQLREKSNDLMVEAAETIFYHTAISQSGRLDTMVLLGKQIALINNIADLYYPHARAKVLPSLYADVIEAALRPSNRGELNLGSQIGPALIGASIVGAIPGANLVSILISDAVVQGSSNALITLRIGLLTRRFFHRALDGGSVDLETEVHAVNQEAADMLEPLVDAASSALARIIWKTAKDHLRRVPAATLEGLKSVVSWSVRGLTGGRGSKADQANDDGAGK